MLNPPSTAGKQSDELKKRSRSKKDHCEKVIANIPCCPRSPGAVNPKCRSARGESLWLLPLPSQGLLRLRISPSVLASRLLRRRLLVSWLRGFLSRRPNDHYRL